MGENTLFGSHEHRDVQSAGSVHTHVCLGAPFWQLHSARPGTARARPPSLVPSLRAEITGQQGSTECQELLH